MRYEKLFPAIPGTTVIHYNCYHDITQEDPVLFWGLGYEDSDAEPYVTPFILNVDGYQAMALDLPDGECKGRTSAVIAFYIPGWGRIAESAGFGNAQQVEGYDPDFGSGSAHTSPTP